MDVVAFLNNAWGAGPQAEWDHAVPWISSSSMEV
ncbi:hypothetical protein GX48_03115 [Paracoccidioides brasiliensis]|nr:hypothetical protein GX48_03115 [Paracoccidioides brasiliensis]